ncbi:MAG: AzlD domain-containing protein [Oceanidesulfovibrio sp.]
MTPEPIELFIIIAGMAAVTYLPRLLPAMFLASRKLPEPLERFLSFVPTAVLAALLAPSILLSDNAERLGLGENVFLWASIPAFFVAWRFRSFFGAVVVGMATVALARLMLG